MSCAVEKISRSGSRGLTALRNGNLSADVLGSSLRQLFRLQSCYFVLFGEHLGATTRLLGV